MNDPGAHPNPLITYGITAVVLAVVLALRMRGMSRERPLRVDRLWIVPAIYAVVVGSVLVQFPPSPIGWVLCAVSAAVGAALGWQRGRMMRLTVDSTTQTVNQRASPAALILIVVLIVIRLGARELADSGSLGSFHITTLLITDLLVTMALGLLTAQRVEMYLRARRLLAAGGTGAVA